MSTAITTVSLFRYKGLANKLWAFGMMQFAHKPLQNLPGQQFYKLMGSGKQLGSPSPDWSVYALLQTWDKEASALEHFREAELQSRYEARSAECSRIFLKASKTHGEWAGSSPFVVVEDGAEVKGPIAVLTRAVIRTSHLRKFWKQAKLAQVPMEGANGLVYSKGIGEVPFKNMATFSIWESTEAMMNFAYKSAEHRKSITMTRELDWYSEELFARFRPYKQIGTWDGKVLIPKS